MRNKITLKKMAQELNVSISTVSKALKDSYEIGEETRERIKAFAKQKGYRPNNIALSLKNKKTKTIGVIIPDVVHYFFAQVINGIEQVAMQKGYNVVVALSNESFEKEVVNLETLADGLIDGFILSLSRETLKNQDYHHIHQTIRQGMDIVLFDRIVSEIECDKVTVDDTKGAYDATALLIERGKKNILLLTTQDYVNVGRLRTQGYIKAFQDNGLPLDNNLIIKTVDTQSSDLDMTILEKNIEKVFRKNNKINGIFSVNEIYAGAALRVLKRLNISVPEQVGIICFTDGLISRYSSPTLTTVKQHGEEIGKVAASKLIDRLEKEEDNEIPFREYVIKTTLIEREST
ncbi:MAG: LacI family transcriptional regulator [Flavobacteriaceae bacterium TMED171]|nr:LacI family transcriptional regulator [Flavobacteriaceae bacterium]OUW32230.1 MAG: LacI family transcriptional regulator [Flavobacteriaceae bacterium TMED171]